MRMPVFPEIAIMAPEILIPQKDIDLGKWAVIACDQYTSDMSYWSQVEALTSDVPSTYHMILPEVYLDSNSDGQIDRRISDINNAIDTYLRDGTLTTLPPGFILLDRSTSFHASRKGLLLSIDLDQYDFTPGSHLRIRATEGTVLSRIPPRVRIRREAKIEIPHIMVLIDDPEHTVIEPAFDSLIAYSSSPVYDFDLMQDGGHVTGYFAHADSPVSLQITHALSSLLHKSADGFLFAVGDGNHSLATAKAHWDAIASSLSEKERESHPARYALVEVVNIHDEGLCFEPIHRVAFGLTSEDFYAYAGTFFEKQGFHFISNTIESEFAGTFDASAQIIPMLCKEQSFQMVLTDPQHSLAVGSLQNVLDHLMATRPDVHLDYIHGEDQVRSLAAAGHLGFLLPSISKNSFFETISAEGVFPRKTFSMGEAPEKRYYLESKRIAPKE
jgi:hypothetical protein